jgi:hypothetical protein
MGAASQPVAAEGILGAPTELVRPGGESLTALIVGLVAAPVVGLVAALVAGYLAAGSFADADTVMGWVYLGLLLVVLLLTTFGTFFLVIEYRQRMRRGGTYVGGAPPGGP